MSGAPETDGAGDDPRLAIAEYVLGVLDPAARAAVAHAIATDPSARAEAEYWQEHFAALNAAYPETAPPARLFMDIEHRLFGAARRAGFWDSLAFWRLAAAGAAAVAVLGIGLALMQPAPVEPPDRAFVTALAPVESDIFVLALYDAGAAALRLSVSGTPVPADRDLELWFIDEGADPVSLGVIPIGEGIAVPLASDLRAVLRQGTTLAVTLEPEGGSPVPGPTGPVVAAGEIQAI